MDAARVSQYGAAGLAEEVRRLYQEGQTDYSMPPIVVPGEQGEPPGCVQPGDTVIFCCRRGEREIQLTDAFVAPGEFHFPRKNLPDLNFVILTLYHEKFKDLPVAFAPARIPQTLAQIVSRAGLRQLHVAESEKYAHVTFFLNGGSREELPGDLDVCIPSPRGVPFDQVPELSLAQVADRVIAGVAEGHDLIVTNFANGDVIGHTASRSAKLRCAEFVDSQLGRVLAAAGAAGYLTLVTADHGNLEELAQPDGSPHVAHTTNPVPLLWIDPLAPVGPALRPGGTLADVAPTILRALCLLQPAAMTGTDLAPGQTWSSRRKVLLIILDGWGIGAADENNPIHLAPTPVLDELYRRCPSTRLAASAEAVGLQAGKAGNSEAGHLNLGAGRTVMQDDVRLDQALREGTFAQNEVLRQAIADVRRRGSRLHLIGLLTEKSSHGSIDYPLAVLRMAKDAGVGRVFLHLIFDGRSTPPGSAPALLERLEEQLAAIGAGRVATGVGRGIALDRDGNYSKTKAAYDAMVFGTGRLASQTGSSHG